MKSIWSYFSLQAQCTECKVEISIYSGAFSVLLAHLRIEHNIIVDDADDDAQGNDKLKQVLKEEILEDEDNEYLYGFDTHEEEMDEDEKPKGIQILQVKQEDEETEKLEEEIYINDDFNHESDGSSDTKKPDKANYSFERVKMPKRKYLKRDSGVVFNRFEYFDQSNENETDSEMICKYCGERFPNNVLTLNNRVKKLKKHLLTVHQEKIEPSVAEYLISQFENEKRKKKEINSREINRLKKKEYKRRYYEKYKKQIAEQAWSIDPETGKRVNLRLIASNERRQNYKCPYEGCSRDAVSEFGLNAHIRAIHTGEKPFVCTQCGKGFVLDAMLRKHMISHSDEANFPCQYCGKRYKHPSSVLKHQTAGKGCEALKKQQAVGTFPT